MTKGEISLLYIEVEKLLNDICKFLSEELNNGYISPTGRSFATILIEKSKQQLQEISKVTNLHNTDCNNEPYVDMHGYKSNQENNETQEVYSDVSLENMSDVLIIEDEDLVCPYENLPASEIKTGKRGQLYRKDKILFFEQQKKVFAAAQDSWLLIYLNENSLKPCQVFDLSHVEARPSTANSKDQKRREEAFDLFSDTDNKLYNFTALTPKDMIQWVAAINKPTEVLNLKRSLPPVPMGNSTNRVSTSSSKYNDYEPLKEYQINHQSDTPKPINIDEHDKSSMKSPLPLPPRNILQKAMPAQDSISKTSSEESSDNYDIVGGSLNQSLQNISNSFSEDDTDTIYDNPSEIKYKELTINPYLHLKSDDKAEENDEIYDYLQSPTYPVQNKAVNNKTIANKTTDCNEKKTKPKPSLKPKLLSLKYKKKNNSTT